MTYNLELLRVRATEIRQALAALRQAGQASAEEFTANADLRDASLYRLLIAIEAAQSICTHLSARLGTRAPQSTPDCFQCLAEAGALQADLAVRLSQMSRFRNLLVHRYWELDHTRVHQILREELHDLESYLGALGVHLGELL